MKCSEQKMPVLVIHSRIALITLKRGFMLSEYMYLSCLFLIIQACISNYTEDKELKTPTNFRCFELHPAAALHTTTHGNFSSRNCVEDSGIEIKWSVYRIFLESRGSPSCCFKFPSVAVFKNGELFVIFNSTEFQVCTDLFIFTLPASLGEKKFRLTSNFVCRIRYLRPRDIPLSLQIGKTCTFSTEPC